MNQVNLIGNLVAKPELRITTTNKKVTECTLAVRRDKDNTDFINIQVWNDKADNLCKYQDKGSKIAVTGSIRQEKYQNATGENRYKVYVLASNIEYLSSKNESNITTSVDNTGDFIEVDNTDDLPF